MAGLVWRIWTRQSSDHATSIPRRQHLLVGPATKVTAVVRIEAPVQSAELDSPNLVSQVAAMIVSSTKRPQVAALQVDFDAARSQRGFYRDLLKQVRKRMPRAMPLSITALAS